MITKKDRPKKNLVDKGDKGTEYAAEFRKFCNTQVIQIYFTMTETTAAFAARTKRSIKHIRYLCMED